MPAFTKTPPEVTERFASVTAGFPQLEPRKMFGYPSVFVNGNLLSGVFQDRIMVRLSEADRAILLAMPKARRFEPMPGRPMREYVEFPPGSTEKEMRRWIEKGIAYVQTLPVKAKKSAKKAATASKTSATKTKGKPRH